MDATDQTLTAYQEAVGLYVAASAGGVASPVTALIDQLVSRLPPSARVVEIGSGPGHEAQYLEDRGLVVDRTDATPAFVALLQDQGHAARVMDVRTGDLGGPYDAVLANAVLLHLSRADLEQSLVACHKATRSGGLLALTLKEGDGEAWTTVKLGLPRWFVFWREEQLRAVLERAGWGVRELRHVEGLHEPWLHVLCEKA